MKVDIKEITGMLDTPTEQIVADVEGYASASGEDSLIPDPQLVAELRNTASVYLHQLADTAVAVSMTEKLKGRGYKNPGIKLLGHIFETVGAASKTLGSYMSDLAGDENHETVKEIELIKFGSALHTLAGVSGFQQGPNIVPVQGLPDGQP